MEFLCPAKVNLHLEVLGRRGDGYHDIQTLMHRVDLCDRLLIRAGGRGIRITSEGEAIPRGMENLASRAARLFCQETGVPGNLEIQIRKRIPVGAGLGGGSSDAAATLMGLNQLSQAGRDEAFLMSLGSRLGADVPFFIFQEPALARGIGEKITRVHLPARLWFLLLIPPFRISTRWAYESYDRMAGEKKEGTPLARSYPDLKSLLPVMKNDLELPAVARYPDIGRMKERLLQAGAAGALMSGSGSVVFGVFEDPEEARRVEKTFPLLSGWRAEISRGI